METKKSYIIFFSWQSTRPDVKKAILKVLNRIANELSEEGIALCVDQDTWNRVGKKRIEVEVLNKIDKCDIFIADLTPICKIDAHEEENRLEKLQPNANVMFEYGYALKAKGEERMILLANLEKGEHIEQLPFDINHDTITAFTIEKGVPNLLKPIKKIIELIDEERKNAVKELDCSVFFAEDRSFETTIHPIFKKVLYVQPRKEICANTDVAVPRITTLDALSMLAQNVSKTGNLLVPKAILNAKSVFGERNLSLCQLKLCFANMGTIELNNCHLSISADNSGIVFRDTNEERTLRNIVALTHRNTIVYEDHVTFHRDILNPNMQCGIDEFYVVVPYDVESFNLHWSMQSTRHHQEGDLIVHVEPEYRIDCIPNAKRVGETEIEDYKEDIE